MHGWLITEILVKISQSESRNVHWLLLQCIVSTCYVSEVDTHNWRLESVVFRVIFVQPATARVFCNEGGSHSSRQGRRIAGGSTQRHKGAAWLVPPTTAGARAGRNGADVTAVPDTRQSRKKRWSASAATCYSCGQFDLQHETATATAASQSEDFQRK